MIAAARESSAPRYETFERGSRIANPPKRTITEDMLTTESELRSREVEISTWVDPRDHETISKIHDVLEAVHTLQSQNENVPLALFDRGMELASRVRVNPEGVTRDFQRQFAELVPQLEESSIPEPERHGWEGVYEDVPAPAPAPAPFKPRLAVAA